MTIVQEDQYVVFDPIMIYDEKGKPVGSREIKQVGFTEDLIDIMIIESSFKGLMKQRLTVDPSEINEILNAPPSKTREEMNAELKKWCDTYPNSKLFVNNSDSLPLISLGKLKKDDEERSGAVAGKLCMICDELAKSLELEENRYAFFIGEPVSYFFIKSDVMNLVGTLDKFNEEALMGLSTLFNAVNRVYFENGAHKCELLNVKKALSEKYMGEFDFLENNGFQYAILNEALEPQLNRGISEKERMTVLLLLGAYRRLEEEFDTDVYEIIAGAGVTCYGLAPTKEYGTIITKGIESIPYLESMKTEHLELVKQGNWEG